MSIHMKFAVPDTPQPLLADLPEEDRLLIVSLRFWLKSPEGQAEVWNLYATRFGAGNGRTALKAFEGFLVAVAESASRKLTHRPAQCCHVAEDETLLAGLVRHAAMGETATAYAYAAMIARPEAADRVVAAACDLGCWIILRAAPMDKRKLH